MEKLSVRLIVQDEALSSSLIPSCVFPSLLKTQRVLTAGKIISEIIIFTGLFLVNGNSKMKLTLLIVTTGVQPAHLKFPCIAPMLQTGPCRAYFDRYT